MKISKKDAKNPDLVTQDLKKGFEWSTKHWKLVMGFSIFFIVFGVIYSIFGQQSKKKEMAVQEKYFEFEKMYVEKKQKFEGAEAQLKNPKTTETKKGNEKPQAEQPYLENIASGDLGKDYGPVVEGFKSIVNSAPTSKGAKMAALQLSEIHVKYKNPDGALEVLNKVNSNSKDFLSSLVKVQLGTLLAEKKDCLAAIKTWDDVLASKGSEFLHPSVKLKKGLCFETLNDTAKAEEIYSQLKNSGNPENKDSAVTKSAEKYLRLLRSRKN